MANFRAPATGAGKRQVNALYASMFDTLAPARSIPAALKAHAVSG
ncbi:hypothetical protein ACQEUX_12405 [Micromonospora sp. CA-259024]